MLKEYDIGHVNNISMLQYQHQWELEQKKTNNAEAPKVDKNNWAKIMENIVLHLKLIRGMKGTPSAYVVQCHIEVAHILPGYGGYLNLDKKMITRIPRVDEELNLKLSHPG